MQTNLARLLALMVLTAAGAHAQEAGSEAAELDAGMEIDELQPAVSSNSLAEMDSAAPDEVNPRVATATLAQDVRRRSVSSGVMDEIDLGRSEITGNQELPKVLYIVPWQKSGPGELMGRPVNTLLDEVLAPIDRTEFIRQVDYYDDLYSEEQE